MRPIRTSEPGFHLLFFRSRWTHKNRRLLEALEPSAQRCARCPDGASHICYDVNQRTSKVIIRHGLNEGLGGERGAHDGRGDLF